METREARVVWRRRIDMRAMVTGATGYIGVHVCSALLDKGWDVHALVRPGSRTDRLPPQTRLHEIDAADLAPAFLNAVPDVVFHLAAQVRADSKGTIAESIVADNVSFGVRVLEAMLASSCRCFINTGTYWEYAEDGSFAPNSLYAASKRAFAEILYWYALKHKISAATLVMFDVYGPNDWRGKLLPALISRLNSNEAMPLTPGEQLLDMVHVEDVAASYVRAVECLHSSGDSPALWSVATGRRLSLRNVLETLGRIAGRSLPVDWSAIPYPPHQVMRPVSLGALPVLPGWQARITLEQGLADLLKQSDQSTRCYPEGGRS